MSLLVCPLFTQPFSPTFSFQQQRSEEGEEGADRLEHQPRGATKMEDDKGHKTSLNFWGRQNCSLPGADTG